LFFLCIPGSRAGPELLTQLRQQIRHHLFRIVRHGAAGLRYFALSFTLCPRLASFLHEFISTTPNCTFSAFDLGSLLPPGSDSTFSCHLSFLLPLEEF
jgi:hypothetical protein